MEKKEFFTRKLEEEDAVDWCYRGEGAANIVLGYQGVNSSLVGKVLRLKKKVVVADDLVKGRDANTTPKDLLLTNQEQKLWSDWPSIAGASCQESLLQAYMRDVMSPLLGPEFVDPGILVQASSQFLEKVANNVHQVRPLSRILTSQIDTCTGSALLISDHCVFQKSSGCEQNEGHLPSISVEIKPKCGFLPTSEFISAKNIIKKSVPRFTMHQILKMSQGQVKMLSDYSPLDLFSDDLKRINQAIDSLFSFPQNNLRLFVGGSMIPDAVSSANPHHANWHMLKEILQGFVFCKDQTDPIEALKDLVVKSLFETSALKNLLAAQKLDTHDIEGAIHAYGKLTHAKNVDCLDGENVLDERSSDCLADMSLLECRQLVRNYLIAATAKDCSLMLTFQQLLVSQTGNTYSDQYKVISSSKTVTPFYVKVNFVDLDLKRLSKMLHYHQMDQEIVRAYMVAKHGIDAAKLDESLQT